MSLPAADDLFRPTAENGTDPAATAPAVSAVPEPAVKAAPKADQKTAPQAVEKAPSQRRSSGRVRHDEKMTVYVTADELLDIEHARLALRRDHGLAVDRGRLVREALAIALAELEHAGDESELVRRLIG
ncbi:hypothetical protein [Marmoricola sp. RAF53]|uniref:hypothetical protein n=1 Tax=Marmoricola sp. RAF53 TaxID=3233059 RepID=UPI003F94ED0F